jgi:hypothetical protein
MTPEFFRNIHTTQNVVDGDEVFVRAEPVGPMCWHMRYRAASTSTYKWEFLGGAPIFAVIYGAELAADSGLEKTTNATWGNLLTPGPDVVAPFAGEYDIEFGATIHTGPLGTNGGGKVAPSVENLAVEEDRALIFNSMLANAQVPVMRSVQSIVTAEANKIRLKYAARVAGSSVGFTNRWIKIYPRRVWVGGDPH